MEQSYNIEEMIKAADAKPGDLLGIVNGKPSFSRDKGKTWKVIESMYTENYPAPHVDITCSINKPKIL